jgi:hypothetical protein
MDATPDGSVGANFPTNSGLPLLTSKRYTFFEQTSAIT